MDATCLLHAVVLMVVTVATAVRASDSDPCPKGMYLRKAALLCAPCTVCEVNTIIRAPCRADADTVCGPFVEFNFFNNERWSGRYRNEGTDTMEGAMGRSRGLMLDPQEGATVAFRPKTVAPPGVANNNRDAVPTSDKWKELCFGLIGALAAVTSLALFYVFITHVKHRHGPCKNTALDDTEAPVVYYHSQLAQHSPSPDRDPDLPLLPRQGDPELPHLSRQLQLNQHKRILNRIFQPGGAMPHANEYVDDVKSSATPFLLHSIPEGEIENYPLAQVHRHDQRHVRMGRQPQGRCPPQDRPHAHHYFNDGPSSSTHVTEMLLNYHRCDSDSSS